MGVELRKSKKEPEFPGVMRYACTTGDRRIKNAACVSGRWLPEIECTGMGLDLHTISSFYGGMINAYY